MNSRAKGARGERQWRDELRANGYAARRGQQFAGSPDSPDVVCESLPWIHFEVKHTERLNLYDAMEQAQQDARGQRADIRGETTEKVPIVVYRRTHRGWLVTMTTDVFFKFLRGHLPPAESKSEPQMARMNTDAGILQEKTEPMEGTNNDYKF